MKFITQQQQILKWIEHRNDRFSGLHCSIPQSFYHCQASMPRSRRQKCVDGLKKWHNSESNAPNPKMCTVIFVYSSTAVFLRGTSRLPTMALKSRRQVLNSEEAQELHSKFQEIPERQENLFYAALEIWKASFRDLDFVTSQLDDTFEEVVKNASFALRLPDTNGWAATGCKFFGPCTLLFCVVRFLVTQSLFSCLAVVGWLLSSLVFLVMAK